MMKTLQEIKGDITTLEMIVGIIAKNVGKNWSRLTPTVSTITQSQTSLENPLDHLFALHQS